MPVAEAVVVAPVVSEGANVGDGEAVEDASSCLANSATSPSVEAALKASDAALALRAGFTRRRTGALRGGSVGGGKLTYTVC